MDAPRDVLVIGAGLAGLRCAALVQQAGLTCTVLEREPGVGGRVRTDEVDGFLLDRGFQVLLTAYPTAKDVFDYGALDLRPFEPGALVYTGDALHRVADPVRRPGSLASTLRSPIGSLEDKLRMLRFRQAILSGDLDALFAREERTTLEVLRDRWGFSERMIERFFRPFVAGITLDPSLRTSSRFFEFVMRMFASGEAAVPANGMQRLPEQLASRLADGTVESRVTVRAAEGGRVVLDDGSERAARAVVLATGGASELVARLDRRVETVGTTTIYFDAPASPVGAPVLVLDGDRSGPATNVAVMSDVAPGYAPPGRSLVCASLPGTGDDDGVETRVRDQLGRWFGAGIEQWRTLRTYRIEDALPDQAPPALSGPVRDVRLADGLFVCGDHRDHGSIEGALRSGRRAAEAVVASLSATS